MKLKLFIITLFLLISCKESIQKTNISKTNWDFTDNKFNEKSLKFLNGYDVFEFNKKSDSTLILKGEIFQGWKKASKKINDTVILNEKYLITDSLNQVKTQLLSYSNKKDIFFQLKIIHKSFNSKKEFNEDSPPIESFDYKGKLFINKKELSYFSEELWYK